MYENYSGFPHHSDTIATDELLNDTERKIILAN